MTFENGSLFNEANGLYLLSGIGGFFLAWLFGLWRDKTTRLTYSVQTERFAASATDVLLGTVEVRWQGQAVPNIFLVTVVVENPTLRDLDDVHVHVFVDKASLLLTEKSVIEGTPEFARYDGEYEARIVPKPGQAPTPEQQGIYHSSRQYRLPVFNRGQRLRLSYLCTHDASATPLPEVFVTGVRKGTKFVVGTQPLVFGVPAISAVTLGLAATVVTVVATVLGGLNLWLVATVCALVGLSGQLVGALIYKAFRLARNIVAG